MSNFLELSNKVSSIIGLQGTISDVTAPKGIQKNIVEAVASSWVDIQTLREDWDFMQAEISSFSLIEDQVVYTPLQVFGSQVAADNLSLYKEKRGIFYDNKMLGYVEWEDLPFVDNTIKREPNWYSIDPSNNNLHFSRPDGAYDLLIRYKKTPQVLTINTDTPSIPAQFHNAIVYMAVERVTAYTGNSPLNQKYSVEANVVIGELFRHYVRARRVYPRDFLI